MSLVFFKIHHGEAALSAMDKHNHEANPSFSSRLYAAWKAFKGEDIRFLGYGDPHIPTQEERVFHAFEQGYRAGHAERGLDFDLPEGCHLGAVEINEG